MSRHSLHIVPASEPRTVKVERGLYRAIISEHIDREVVYLLLENGRGHSAAFLEPTAALAIAAALIEGAAAALDHQFRRQLGSP